jgi:hypothetical protein
MLDEFDCKIFYINFTINIHIREGANLWDPGQDLYIFDFLTVGESLLTTIYKIDFVHKTTLN